MNYLGHYVYNHEVCGLPADPYFVLGVALPDLWPRFSRVRRIRWGCVRSAADADGCAAELRAGLLNHAEADRRFHALPTFLEWQQRVRSRARAEAVSPNLLDFLTHLAIELALDHRLVCQDAGRACDFYDRVRRCDPARAERFLRVLAGVDTAGLGREIEAFVRRRFLPRFAERETAVQVMSFVLHLANVPRTPPASLLRGLFGTAADLVEPERVWREMRAAAGLPSRMPAAVAQAGRR